MKNKQIVILMLGLFFPMMSFSQTDVALDPEFGGRVSVSVDKKITKGLHASLEEEVRFDNNFGSELLKKWDIPENFIARAFVLLGYCEGEYPQSKPRRDGRVVIVDED